MVSVVWEDSGKAARITIPDLSMPSGHGALGYGETFQADPFMGTAGVDIPLFTPPARGAEPQLSLRYTSGAPNGVFGLGFALPLPSVSRRTDLGIPRYAGTDTFVLADGSILVPRYEREAAGWLPVERIEEYDGKNYVVVAYRRSSESTFDVIEQWTDLADETDCYWQVVNPVNERTILGRSPQCRIADPDHPGRIWRWLVEEQIDTHGNKTVFEYAGDEGKANRYLRRIAYGPYRDAVGAERLAFALVFGYEERPDPFSSFRPGFEVRTDRLCQDILTVHDLPDALGPAPVVVSTTTLDYEADAGVSLLRRVRRTGRRTGEDGAVWTMPLPPLTLGYTPWEPHRADFRDLVVEKPGTLPAPLDDRGCQLADLYADGLPGVLTVAPPAVLYSRPLGDGRFAPEVNPPVMPVHPPTGDRRLALVDITGSGPLDLVLAEPDWGGYYGNEQGAWEPFASFRGYPADLADPLTLLVDLTGDGRPDLLSGDDGQWRVTLSAGRAGFTDPVTVAPPPEIDAFRSAAETVFVGFADIFGDGLSHLVRVSDGNVQVWPCLGYGRFGGMREIPGAPRFGPGLVASRIFLADVDGDGAADLIFMYEDRVELHRNRFGGGFGAPVVHRLPGGLCALDQVLLADVFGRGATSVVVSDAIGGEHHCLDYVANGRPYLLSAVENELGASTRIEYRSSVEYALADRAAGRPWVTSLPFPVQVVARVETVDPASAARLDSVHEYHDGYFDPIQRQFRGFGFVETRDRPVSADAGEGSETRLRKIWTQTGAFVAEQAVAAQLAADSFRLDPDPLALPAVHVDPAIVALGADAMIQAWRALASELVRLEEYGVAADGRAKPVPYLVAQATSAVMLVQPPLDGYQGVYQVLPWERAGSEYGQVADDPRIEHQLNLEFDRFGHPLLAARLAYARRPLPDVERLPEQHATQLQFSLSGVTNHVDGRYYDGRAGDGGVHRDGESFHVVGVEVESRDYRISGLASPAGYLDRKRTAAIVAESLSGTGPVQAHLIGWWQRLYWDETRTGPLPLFRLSPQLLTHHRQVAVLPDPLVAEVYGNRVDAELLAGRGGYRRQDGHWWSWRMVAYYEGADRYFLDRAVDDPFGGRIIVGYDSYALELTRHTDALGQTVTAVIDYQALAPASITDVNANVTQARYDPLGRAFVASRHGVKDGRLVGDDPLEEYVLVADATAEQVLADPRRFVQGAGTYTFTDLSATGSAGRGPARTITVLRRHFANPEEAGSAADDQVAIEVRYFDAFQRTLGSAVLLAGPEPVPGGAAPAWIFTGVLRYDDRGEPYRRYLPYQATSPEFVVSPPAPSLRVRYDAIGRETHTHTPDGFLTRTFYEPWSEAYWDADDTVLESPYYREHAHDPHLPPPEREALEAAVRLRDTPTVQALDVFGRVIQITTFLVGPDGGEPVPLRTYRWLNARGEIVATADPRFTSTEDPDRPHYYNTLSIHDLTGQLISTRSSDVGDVPLDRRDAGTPRLILRDALAVPIEEWDQRGFRVAHHYDILRRPVRVHVTGDGLDQDTELLRYGSDAQANTVDRVTEQFDQAGVLTYPAYALTGGPAERTRRYRADDRGEANWDDPGRVPLEPGTWASRYRYDALGELEAVSPLAGLEVSRRTYDNGWVRAVSVKTGTGEQAVVADATYRPQGAPDTVRYGDGAVLHYQYSPANQRLTGLTGQAGDAEPVLRLGYTYDPVGNVTHIQNDSVLPAEPGPVPDGSGDYRYDSLYQLRTGTGREQAGAPDSADAGAASIERYEERYGYDHSGNLTSIDHTSGTTWSRTTVISPSSNHGVPAGQADGRSPDDFFDPGGNLTELESGARLGYDYIGRMTSAALAATTTWSQYDHAGLRARRVDESPGDRRETLYVDDLVIERDAGDLVTLRVPFGGRLAALLDVDQSDGVRIGAARYQFQDRLGSVSYELDTGGDVVSCEEYRPYGSTALLLGRPEVLATKRYRYSGKELDPDSGLYDYGLRYYIPAQGRWTTPDPAGEIDGLNLFAYVRGNPVTATDPTGENGDKDQPSSQATKPLKLLTTFNTLVNAFSDAFIMLKWTAQHTYHANPVQIRLAAFTRLAAHGAIFGGFTGGLYNWLDARKYGWNIYNSAAFVGSLLFIVEGGLIHSTVLHADNNLHRRHHLTGKVGAAADFLKIPKAVKDGNYWDAAMYAFLGTGNLLSGFSPQQLGRFGASKYGRYLRPMLAIPAGVFLLTAGISSTARQGYLTYNYRSSMTEAERIKRYKPEPTEP
jgi:RHS repeat-associated protein